MYFFHLVSEELLRILLHKNKNREALWGLLACSNIQGNVDLETLKELKLRIDLDVIILSD